MIRVSHFAVAIALAAPSAFTNCFAAWSISTAPAVLADDCNDFSPLINRTPTPYASPPAAYPTPNSYYSADSGDARLTIMDAYCGSPDCYGFGKSLLVEFDWLALESAHLVVQTTFNVPLFPYVEEVNRFTGLFSELPASAPAYASTPESRRVSFFTYYETLDGSDLLTLEFYATNAVGEASVFGVDNLRVATVPEPATTVSLYAGLVVMTKFCSRVVADQRRRRHLAID